MFWALARATLDCSNARVNTCVYGTQYIYTVKPLYNGHFREQKCLTLYYKGGLCWGVLYTNCSFGTWPVYIIISQLAFLQFLGIKRVSTVGYDTHTSSHSCSLFLGTLALRTEHLQVERVERITLQWYAYMISELLSKNQFLLGFGTYIRSTHEFKSSLTLWNTFFVSLTFFSSLHVHNMVESNTCIYSEQPKYRPQQCCGEKRNIEAPHSQCVQCMKSPQSGWKKPLCLVYIVVGSQLIRKPTTHYLTGTTRTGKATTTGWSFVRPLHYTLCKHAWTLNTRS